MRAQGRPTSIAIPGTIAAVFGLALLILVAGCESGNPKVLAPAVPPPASTEVLLAASDTLSLVGFGSVYALDLIRDFASPNGHPLTARLTFSLVSASDFSSEVSALYIWVVNGSEVWSAGMVMQDPNQYPHDEVVWIAQDGPQWAPGTQVEAVIGLQIRGRGLQLVRLPSATITQTNGP